MAKINFNATADDFGLIGLIVRRAERDAVKLDIPLQDNRMTMTMDLVACHMNGNPLDLQRLLDAPAPDFWHDMHGIRRHIDRETGVLGDCFSPRCSAKVEA